MDLEFKYFYISGKVGWKSSLNKNLNLGDTMKVISSKRYKFDSMSYIQTSSQSDEIKDMSEYADLIYMLKNDNTICSYDMNRDRYSNFLDGEIFEGIISFEISQDGVLHMILEGQEEVYRAYYTKTGQILESINSDYEEFYPIALCINEDGKVYFLSLDKVKESGEVARKCKLSLVEHKAGRKLKRLNTFDVLIEKEDILSKAYSVVCNNKKICILNKKTGILYEYNLSKKKLKRQKLPKGLIDCILVEEELYLLDNIKDCIYKKRDEINEIVEGYRGRASNLIRGHDNDIYIYDKMQSTITKLRREFAPKKDSQRNIIGGIYLSNAIDSGEEDMSWHKIVTKYKLKDEAEIKVYYMASNDKGFRIDGEVCDFDEYISNQNIDFNIKEREIRKRFKRYVINPEDALFRRTEGRYLWLMIELKGTYTSVPEIEEIKIYYDRISYLRYLPEIYSNSQDYDTDEGNFLERFMCYFETLMNEVEEKIDNSYRLFNPKSAPEDMLDWLAKWIGIENIEKWSKDKKRKYMIEAASLQSIRGTRKCISRIVELYTGEKPFIVEYFEIEEMLNNKSTKDLIEELYGDNPSVFTIIVDGSSVKTEEELMNLKEIIDAEKPVYSIANVIVLKPWMYLDSHTYLGVNSYIAENSPLILDGESSIPNNTLIGRDFLK